MKTQLAEPAKALHYRSEMARVSLVEYNWDEPIDITGCASSYLLQLVFFPVRHVSKACFPDHWGKNRFERFGEISLLPPYERVHCITDLREQRSLCFHLDPTAVEQWTGRKADWSHYPLEKLLDISSSRIRNLLLTLSEELQSPGFGSDYLMEMVSGQLIIELSRYIGEMDENKVQGGLSARNLRLVEERVRGEARPPSIGELARMCNLSVRHLSRAFSASMGRSIGEYITEWRIEHARRLLASGSSIKSVSYEVGFSAPSNFSTAFLRETGESPTQYRLRAMGRRTDASPHREP